MTSTDSKSEQLLKLDSLGRVRTSPAKRDEILDAFEASGMSGASFAKQHGIRYSTFAYWVQRRRKIKGTENAATEPKFAEVVARAGANAVAALTIGLPGGASAEVRSPGDVVLAAALIKEIAGGGVGC